MRKTFLAFIALGLMLTLASCSSLRGDRPLVIESDGGGVIAHRLLELKAINLSGREVQIRGWCASACTLYLAAKNVCVTPEATLAFHGSAMLNGGDLPRPFFELWSDVMAAHYPKAIADWYMAEARHSSTLSNISGAQLIEDGVVRECA